MTRYVLVFCAHHDDEAFGPGGTLAAYAKQGIASIAVVFSRGDMSHPHYKIQKLQKIRLEESETAGKLLGIQKVYGLGLKDTKLMDEAKTPAIYAQVRKLIEKYKPEKIFTHSSDDVMHQDHKAVNDVVEKVVKELNSEGTHYPVYTFNIWSLSFRKRDAPKLIVNISEEFSIKVEALRAFKSQKLAYFVLIPFVYAKAIIVGWKNDFKYAEEFYKVL